MFPCFQHTFSFVTLKRELYLHFNITCGCELKSIFPRRVKALLFPYTEISDVLHIMHQSINNVNTEKVPLARKLSGNIFSTMAPSKRHSCVQQVCIHKKPQK